MMNSRLPDVFNFLKYSIAYFVTRHRESQSECWVAMLNIVQNENAKFFQSYIVASLLKLSKGWTYNKYVSEIELKATVC